MGVGIILLVIGAAVATTLLFLGWRGRRVDDHPVCRRCGFDLFGLPPDSSRCSECGADVTLKRAMRRGHRRKRRKLLAAALAVLLPVLICGGLMAWPRVKSIRPVEYKPVWWLMSDLNSSSTTTADSALDELLRRHGAKTLSKEHAIALADRILSTQAQLPGALPKNLADVIVLFQEDGTLTPQQWERFWRQMLSVKLAARQQVHQGDPVAQRIEVTAPRIPTGLLGRYLYYVGIESVTIDGQPAVLQWVPADADRWVPRINDLPDFVSAVDPNLGRHTARCEVRVKVYGPLVWQRSRCRSPNSLSPPKHPLTWCPTPHRQSTGPAGRNCGQRSNRPCWLARWSSR